MITVIKAPPFATVQDLGRSGHRSVAVPPAGALDRRAIQIGNLLVGNETGAAAVEWAIGAGEIRFDCRTTVALTGASADVELAGRVALPHAALNVAPGDTLRVNRLVQGSWLYICVAGGIEVPPVLGSRSTYLPGSFGGVAGHTLRAGDRLPIGTPARPRLAGAGESERAGEITDWGTLHSAAPLAVLAGPDRRFLPDAEWARFLDTEFRVSNAVSRLGYRLHGPTFHPDAPADLPSTPTSAGAIQIPVDGNPIVLRPDGPTVGGYPIVAVIISTEIGRLAQRRPGEGVRFHQVELAAARDALRRDAAALERLARASS